MKIDEKKVDPCRSDEWLEENIDKFTTVVARGMIPVRYQMPDSWDFEVSK